MGLFKTYILWVVEKCLEDMLTNPSTFYLVGRYTLDEFGTARRSAVVRGFIDALTRGGPGGTPRPIEMHSHDPLRYLKNIVTINKHVYLHSNHDEIQYILAFRKSQSKPTFNYSKVLPFSSKNAHYL